MTITHVQNTALTTVAGPGDGASITATWGSATTDGNLLLAVLSANTTNANFTAPTNAAGWTLAIGGTDSSAAGEMGYIHYIANAASRSGVETFTIPHAITNDAGLQLFEVNIDSKAQTLDQTAQASVSNAGATTAPDSGLTSATSQGDEYIFAVIANRNVQVPTSPAMGGTATGGSVAQWDTQSSTSAASSETTQTTYDRQTTGAGTIGIAGTLSVARAWNALIATFSLAAATPNGVWFIP